MDSTKKKLENRQKWDTLRFSNKFGGILQKYILSGLIKMNPFIIYSIETTFFGYLIVSLS